MARTKAKVRSNRTIASKASAGARRRLKASTRVGVKARPTHKFVARKFDPADFKTDGLRSYAQYRDLGIKDATRGMVLAHVVRFVGQCDPKIVSKTHLHDTEFQMIYVLKGTIITWFEGQGTHTMKPGDSWIQPQRLKHKVLDYSPDCEVLEIVMPADFETVELEK